MNVRYSFILLILISACISQMTASQPQNGTQAAAEEGSPVFVAGHTYFGTSEYIEYLAGDLPVIISVPHGGHLEPSEIPDREIGTNGHYDVLSQELARDIIEAFRRTTGKTPHVIINRLHRNKLDANREPADAAGDHPIALNAWEEFHQFIDGAEKEVAAVYGKGLYIDLHGHRHTQQFVELGYLLVAGQLALTDHQMDSTVQPSETSVGFLLHERTLPLSSCVRGEASFGSLLEKQGYAAVPSAGRPAPNGKQYFSGGYNLERHSSFSGLPMCGLQVETPMNVREDEGERKKFAQAFAGTVMEFLKRHGFVHPGQ
jgi:hypothetical protein